jgi:hypothetical protein
MVRQAPDHAAVLDNVRQLRDASSPPIGEVERALTDGYACVLLSEGERLRMRRLLEERARSLGPASGQDEVVELAALAQGIARAGREIDELRAALDELAATARRLRVA